MILVALLWGAFAAHVFVIYWKDTINWLKRGIEEVIRAIKTTVYGVKVFVKKISEAIEEISKYYSKDKYGKWYESTRTRRVCEIDVPPEILERAKRSQNEVDISMELKLQLS